MWTDDQILLQCDHHHNLQKLVDTINRLAGSLPEEAAFIDIGTRAGGSAMISMRAIAQSYHNQRWLFSIDPYGSKPYKQGRDVINGPYGEEYYLNAMTTLYGAAKEKWLNYYHWRMKSTDFMKIWDNVEFYDKAKVINSNPFGFVYLDGDHDNATVTKELEFFYPRMIEGGMIALDDVQLYDRGYSVLLDMILEDNDGDRAYLVKE